MNAITPPDELTRLRAALRPFAEIARAALEHEVRLAPTQLVTVQWDEGTGSYLRWRDFAAAIAALGGPHAG